MRPCTWSSFARLLFVSMLCCGVVLQMLGVTMSFWDLNGSSDLVATSLLEGFAVLPNGAILPAVLRSSFTTIEDERAYRYLRQQMLFHPPPFSR